MQGSNGGMTASLAKQVPMLGISPRPNARSRPGIAGATVAQLICPSRLGKNQNRSPSESKMFYLGAVDRGCVESPTRFEAL